MSLSHIYSSTYFLLVLIFRCVNMIYFVSAKNKDCGRASPGGGGPDLLRQGLHHQAEVRGGEHRGGAARVHHLEEGEQDAQLRHREGRHQVTAAVQTRGVSVHLFYWGGSQCLADSCLSPFCIYSPLTFTIFVPSVLILYCLPYIFHLLSILPSILTTNCLEPRP